MWPENLILMHANNKGADQPAFLLSLISTIVMERMIATLEFFSHQDQYEILAIIA